LVEGLSGGLEYAVRHAISGRLKMFPIEEFFLCGPGSALAFGNNSLGGKAK
jgi:hypothetical protein